MTATPNEPDLSNWLTDAEVLPRLGYTSTKSLDREVARNNLHPRYRPREGKKGQRVFDPEEILRRQRPAVASVLPAVQTPIPTKPTPSSELSESGRAPLVRTEDTERVIARLLDMVVEGRKPPKPWIDLDQAEEATGLSRAFLYRLIRRGDLDAVRDRRLKVRREDLEDLDVESQLIKPGKRGRK